MASQECLAISLTAPCSSVTRCPPISDRKSTRLNSSYMSISYAVFCLKKKKHGKLQAIERGFDSKLGRPCVRRLDRFVQLVHSFHIACVRGRVIDDEQRARFAHALCHG